MAANEMLHPMVSNDVLLHRLIGVNHGRGRSPPRGVYRNCFGMIGGIAPGRIADNAGYRIS